MVIKLNNWIITVQTLPAFLVTHKNVQVSRSTIEYFKQNNLSLRSRHSKNIFQNIRMLFNHRGRQNNYN